MFGSAPLATWPYTAYPWRWQRGGAGNSESKLDPPWTEGRPNEEIALLGSAKGPLRPTALIFFPRLPRFIGAGNAEQVYRWRPATERRRRCEFIDFPIFGQRVIRSLQVEKLGFLNRFTASEPFRRETPMSLRLATLDENSRDAAKYCIFNKTSGYFHDSKRRSRRSSTAGQGVLWTSLVKSFFGCGRRLRYSCSPKPIMRGRTVNPRVVIAK